MESTYTKRRSQSGGRRGGKREELTAQEKRRLLQLAASVGLFLLVFAGRGVFPQQTGRWKEALGRNIDFGAAFTRFGASVSRGEPVWDTLGKLCTEVFAGGTAELKEVPLPNWSWAPVFSQRMMAQLATPNDGVSVWSRQQREAQIPPAQPSAEQAPQQPEQPSAEQAPQQPEQPAAEPSETVEKTAAEEPGQSALTADTLLQVQPPDSSGEEPAVTLNLEKTVCPVAGVVTSAFGYRNHPVSGENALHRGVDVGAPEGSDIVAFADGTVEYTGRDDQVCGLYLQIDHGGGVKTFYAHCGKLLALDGQKVKAGDVVAKVGSTGNATGPHLHFALRKDGEYLDPALYVQAG